MGTESIECVEHFANVIEDDAIGVQIGVVTESLPHTHFQIFRMGESKMLTLSPFRLGEQPNIRLGVAMITSAPEAITLHEKAVSEIGTFCADSSRFWAVTTISSNWPVDAPAPVATVGTCAKVFGAAMALIVTEFPLGVLTSVILGSRGRHLLTFNEHGHLQQAGGHVVTYR